jgi:hypothetical protein
MEMSGSIRRTERKTGQAVASRNASPLFAFPQEQSPRVRVHSFPDPVPFFPVDPPKVFCTVPKSVPSQRTVTAHFIPLERKPRLGATRSNFHE